MTSRREFIAGAAASAAALSLPSLAVSQANAVLAMPPLLDIRKSGRFDLIAQEGSTNFLGKSASTTWGFNQAYLGPTIRAANKGDVQASLKNTLNEEISAHWHGLLIPGEVDGGPHQTVAPNTTWKPVLDIDQPAATLWYHSHIHGSTGRHVQMGLAGVLQLSDGQDDQRGLPSDYGVDDLMLVLQDRNFNWRGKADYDPGMRDRMNGFLGDTMLINGQANTLARVPKGIVRLRLLNGSNSRVYALAMSDGRPMHLVGSEAGLLDKPITLSQMLMGPGERAEVLVDFGNGKDVTLVTGPNPNRGMMGGMMGGGGGGKGMILMPFTVDPALPVRISKLPENLGGSLAQIAPAGAVRRNFTLDMGMGGGMMSGMFGGSGNQFSINGKSFDMETLNFTTKLGSLERWSVTGQMMMHPFHVHGVSFQVLSENGRAPRPENLGWKDTVLVNGQAELLMRFDRPAGTKTPYMYHCHILEHEDGGMMGQFAVT